MAMLQTEKVRLTDYLDERSDYLTKFAEDANTEIDKIGEEALKELDAASNSVSSFFDLDTCFSVLCYYYSSRSFQSMSVRVLFFQIMEKLDSRMQAFEESAELNRVEIEETESKLSDFEDQIDKGKNEGLFFQGMGKKAPVENVEAMKETKKIKEVTIAIAGSKSRRNIYLALIGLSAIAIGDSFLSTAPDWKKVAVLGAVLIALLTQLSYEQGVSSEPTKTESERIDSGKSDEKNK